MRKVLTTVIFAALFGASALTPVAAQRSSCPGGEAKTASGACVNAGLSGSMRQRSVLMSQPKISQTAFPIPPSLDRRYPRPGEYNRYELIFGIFSTNPSPLSCHPAC